MQLVELARFMESETLPQDQWRWHRLSQAGFRFMAAEPALHDRLVLLPWTTNDGVERMLGFIWSYMDLMDIDWAMWGMTPHPRVWHATSGIPFVHEAVPSPGFPAREYVPLMAAWLRRRGVAKSGERVFYLRQARDGAGQGRLHHVAI